MLENCERNQGLRHFGSETVTECVQPRIGWNTELAQNWFESNPDNARSGRSTSTRKLFEASISTDVFIRIVGSASRGDSNYHKCHF
jgi:hypothetical protein